MGAVGPWAQKKPIACAMGLRIHTRTFYCLGLERSRPLVWAKKNEEEVACRVDALRIMDDGSLAEGGVVVKGPIDRINAVCDIGASRCRRATVAGMGTGQRGVHMGKNKVAVYTGVGSIAVKEAELTKPPPYCVTLDTKCSGICGSDLHSYFGRWEQSPEHASGHEASGIIYELGDSVEGFAVGDRVTFECFTHCGSCIYCRNGLHNHCTKRRGATEDGHGGFAEYSTVHSSSLYELPSSMSFEQGALIEPLAVSHRGVARSGVSYRDRIAVIGGGTIGLLCLAVAKVAGAKETLISVKYDHQAKLAEELGADHVMQIGEANLVEYTKDLTRGQYD